MASAPKTSSLKQGLKSSFSSGGKFSLGGVKKTKVDDPQAQLSKKTTDDFARDQSQKNILKKRNFVPLPPPPKISQAEKLDVLDGVISEIEEAKVSEPKIARIKIPPTKEISVSNQQDLNSVAQVVPQVLTQPYVSPPAPQSSKKETFVSAYAVPETTPDSSGGVQVVEQERTPEVPPEVESFLQHAQDHATKLPEEIVIADNQEISKVTHYPKTPVLVLPITPEEEKLGKKKNPKFSIRWLVEWSYKIMKKFSGKVVYRIDE